MMCIAVARQLPTRCDAQMEIETLLKAGFDFLDEAKTGSITFRSMAYGKFGPTLKERLSTEAMESLTEEPAGEVDKEM